MNNNIPELISIDDMVFSKKELKPDHYIGEIISDVKCDYCGQNLDGTYILKKYSLEIEYKLRCNNCKLYVFKKFKNKDIKI
ncbi:MAG: hypothetical protein ACOC2W_00225 [bacterium]